MLCQEVVKRKMKKEAIWKYNKRSGMWDHQRNVESDTKDQWLGIYKKDEPDSHFHVSSKKPKHNPTMKEEMSTAGVVGTGDDPTVWKPSRPIARRGKFAQYETFIVSSSTFNSLKSAKKKKKHWRTYLEEDDAYHDLREYAKKCKGPIVVEDERTGTCMFVRYGNMK